MIHAKTICMSAIIVGVILMSGCAKQKGTTSVKEDNKGPAVSTSQPNGNAASNNTSEKKQAPGKSWPSEEQVEEYREKMN